MGKQLRKNIGKREEKKNLIRTALAWQVLDFDKNKRTNLPVIAQRTSLGNITEGSLKESISRFLKKSTLLSKKIKYLFKNVLFFIDIER